MSLGKSAGPRVCQLRRLEQENEAEETSPRTLKATPFWPTAHAANQADSDILSNDEPNIFSLRSLLQAYTAMYEDGSSDWHAFGWKGQELSLFELVLDADQFNARLRVEAPDLICFLCEPSNIVSLADVLVRDPGSIPGSGIANLNDTRSMIQAQSIYETRMNKLPAAAQDVLCSGNGPIFQACVASDDFWRILLRPLDHPPPMDQMCASRLATVIAHLYANNPSVVRNCILQALPVARGGDDGETTSSTPPPGLSGEVCHRGSNFETSLCEADDPFTYRLIKHLGDDNLVDLLRSLVVSSYGLDPPLLKSVATLPFHLVEQMGRNHLWDMSMTDVTERADNMQAILISLLNTHPPFPEFQSFLLNLIQDETLDLLTDLLKHPIADLARTAAGLFSALLNRCEDLVAEYEARAPQPSIDLVCPSPAISTPLSLPSSLGRVTSPQTFSEQRPVSVVETGLMEGEGEEFEWGGLKLADLDRGSRFAVETAEFVGNREQETREYENEATQLSEQTLIRIKRVISKIALGPLRDILKAYFEPKVERALAYRRSRHRCRPSVSTKRAKPSSSEDGLTRRLMHRRSSATELRGAEWEGADSCRRASSFTRRGTPKAPVERARSWPAQQGGAARGGEPWGVGPVSLSDGEATSVGPKRESLEVKAEKAPSFPRPKVGVLSLSYLHLVYSVIRLNTEETREFAKHFLPCLIEMFFVYKWCTLLHNLVKTLVVFAIECDPPEGPLIRELINRTDLITQLIKVAKRQRKIRMEVDLEERRMRRLRNRTGNVPQALKIADALIAAARGREWLRSSLVGTDGWRRNVVAEVRYYAEIVRKSLGGPVPGANECYHEGGSSESEDSSASRSEESSASLFSQVDALPEPLLFVGGTDQSRWSDSIAFDESHEDDALSKPNNKSTAFE